MGVETVQETKEVGEEDGMMFFASLRCPKVLNNKGVESVLAWLALARGCCVLLVSNDAAKCRSGSNFV